MDREWTSKGVALQPCPGLSPTRLAGPRGGGVGRLRRFMPECNPMSVTEGGASGEIGTLSAEELMCFKRTGGEKGEAWRVVRR